MPLKLCQSSVLRSPVATVEFAATCVEQHSTSFGQPTRHLRTTARSDVPDMKVIGCSPEEIAAYLAQLGGKDGIVEGGMCFDEEFAKAHFLVSATLDKGGKLTDEVHARKNMSTCRAFLSLTTSQIPSRRADQDQRPDFQGVLRDAGSQGPMLATLLVRFASAAGSPVDRCLLSSTLRAAALRSILPCAPQSKLLLALELLVVKAKRNGIKKYDAILKTAWEVPRPPCTMAPSAPHPSPARPAG